MNTNIIIIYLVGPKIGKNKKMMLKKVKKIKLWSKMKKNFYLCYSQIRLFLDSLECTYNQFCLDILEHEIFKSKFGHSK